MGALAGGRLGYPKKSATRSTREYSSLRLRHSYGPWQFSDSSLAGDGGLWQFCTYTDLLRVFPVTGWKAIRDGRESPKNSRGKGLLSDRSLCLSGSIDTGALTRTFYSKR